jgi:hypothetical protein
VPQNPVPSAETESKLNSTWRFKLYVPQNTVPYAETAPTLKLTGDSSSVCGKTLCFLLKLHAH